MLHSAVHFLHAKLNQGNCAVQHGFQVRGHGVAVQRKAPDDQIRFQVCFQNAVLVILLNALAIALLSAAKAAKTGTDILFDHMDDCNIACFFRRKSLQKTGGHAHGIAFLFGTAVEHQYVHLFTPLVPVRNMP